MGFPPWSRGPLLHRGEKRQLSPFGRTRGFKPRVRYNLISLCVLRARTSLSDLLLIAPRRQDRKENFLDPPPWRPLRLCESNRLSDSLNPNSAENFKYLWTVFVYPVPHEDHEEFTIKLYPPLRFKPRGRYNLIFQAIGFTEMPSEAPKNHGHIG